MEYPIYNNFIICGEIMQLNIKGISIKKLDAYRETAFPPMITKELQVSVNVNIGVIDLKKLQGKDALIKANYNLDIVDIGHIGAQLDVLIAIDEIDEIISTWHQTKENRELPMEIRSQVDNAIFYYIMPLIMSLCEKLTIPIPIPPLHNLPKSEVKITKK